MVPNILDEHDFVFQTGSFTVSRTLLLLVPEEERINTKQKNLQSKPPEFQYSTYSF